MPQLPQLPLETGGQRQVIGIEPGDEWGAGLADTDVRGVGLACPLLDRDATKPRVGGPLDHLGRAVRRAVVDDDQLQLPHGLGENTADGGADRVGRVVYWHHDADERRIRFRFEASSRTRRYPGAERPLFRPGRHHTRAGVGAAGAARVTLCSNAQPLPRHRGRPEPRSPDRGSRARGLGLPDRPHTFRGGDLAWAQSRARPRERGRGRLPRRRLPLPTHNAVTGGGGADGAIARRR